VRPATSDCFFYCFKEDSAPAGIAIPVIAQIATISEEEVARILGEQGLV